MSHNPKNMIRDRFGNIPKVSIELDLRTLNKALVKELYSAYKVDFELFGYEADDFFILPTS